MSVTGFLIYLAVVAVVGFLVQWKTKSDYFAGVLFTGLGIGTATTAVLVWGLGQPYNLGLLIGPIVAWVAGALVARLMQR